MNITDIRFPNLNLLLSNVGSGITIGGFEIKFYGMIIASGFLMGLWAAMREAKRTGQDPELYVDYLLCMAIPAIVGARLYYVIFSWEHYKDDLMRIFRIREGGLAIFGGIIAGVLVLFIFAKVRKQSFWKMVDTLSMSLLIGQIMGRWGNFFNREAFGGFTENILAMQIPVDYFREAGRIGEITKTGLLEYTVEAVVNGTTMTCIQVHPTFLYECLWNIGVLLILYFYRKRKKFDGELFAMYLAGYGAGRFWIESLRVDQLQIGNTGLAVSQLLSAVLVIGALGSIFYMRNKKNKAADKQ